LLIRNPGLPIAKTLFTTSGISFRASDFQCAVVIDINKSEKLNGSPPLFVLMKISKTVSISCVVSR
jgi:hypothetical protein